MNIVLTVLERLGRKRIIMDRLSNEPYLTRYYLFLKERKWFPINIFLHNFHKGDPDDLHDHPWNFLSIPLYPGYWEITRAGRFWRGPLSIRYADSTFLHRVG